MIPFGHSMLSLLAGAMSALASVQGPMIGEPRPLRATKGAHPQLCTKPGGRRGIYNTAGAKTYRVKGLRP